MNPGSDLSPTLPTAIGRLRANGFRTAGGCRELTRVQFPNAWPPGHARHRQSIDR